MNKNEIEISEFEIHLKSSFVCALIYESLSNVEIISA